ncbi:ABC transporter permease [Metabacillus fastidiosus]|uniref:ABC transporter permease n=1 Tax=Metabacillus fastidiosus TaxID=1458 RepID=A0ABU6P237_9BACI|nr:ABC transporter permease [Metabacillus fastidiosus]MED4403429.1 ABC transporter permease [Metabacillus fastidiosus]MED4460783.1 ABC transporter permease [Metabacillus fastidiosus]
MASDVAKTIILSKKGSLRKQFLYKTFRSEIFLPVLAFLVFITLWQFILQLLNIPSYLLPKPTDIASAAFENGTNLIESVLTTAIESIFGFLLSVIIGVSSAVLLASSRIIEKSIYPYAIILQTIPIVAIAPIIVIWFGAGINSIIVITFLISFFPMLSNTLIGLHSTDQNLKNLFYLYNANRWQLMWRLRIPGALPYIVGGLKVSCTLSVIGAIVGEYIAGIGGSQGGLGYAITSAAMRLETPYLFACGLSASLLGISFFLVVNYISKRLLSSWHESEMKTEN